MSFLNKIIVTRPVKVFPALTIYSTVVTVYTTQFNIQQTKLFPHRVYLWVSYKFQTNEDYFLKQH
jgi:hypothetical protein